MRLLVFNLATDVDDPVLGFATRWLQVLSERVESIAVVTMRAGRIDLPTNVRVWSVGKEQGYSELRRAVRFYRLLGGLLRTQRIDVCFSHMIPVFSVLAAPVLRRQGIPLVTWYAHREVTSVLKLAHWLSDAMVASTETAYQYRRDKLVVVGQGVDTEWFVPLAPPDDPPLVVSVGRIAPIKDLLTLVRALAVVRDHGLRVHGALVGDALPRDQSYARRVQTEIVQLGLADSVQVVGWQAPAEVRRWYQRATVHVNLAPTGAPDKAAFEAMASGRPSLVANEAFRPTLGPWAERLQFKHGDATDLAAHLAGVLAMPAEARQQMGSDLREQVIARHSLQRLADRMVILFRDVAHGHAA